MYFRLPYPAGSLQLDSRGPLDGEVNRAENEREERRREKRRKKRKEN